MKAFFNRALAAILLSVILLSFKIPLISAVEKTGEIYPYNPKISESYQVAQDYIAKKLRSLDEKIDVKGFGITTDNVVNIFRALCFDNPDIFYVNASDVTYDYITGSKTVFTIYPKYILSHDKIPQYVSKFNKAVENFISGIPAGLSKMNKALYIHDKLISDCSYKKVDKVSYTAYSAIVNHKSICEGYSRAYSYLLSKCGIDSKVINSVDMAHCWNMVKLSDSWYHVDVTSDDPLPDRYGFVSHEYFLCSDDLIKRDKSANKHYKWKKDISYSSDYICDNDKYDTTYFRNIKSQIVFTRDKKYYIDNNYKGKYYSAFIERQGSSKKVLTLIKDQWYNSKNLRYLDSFSKLSERNGYIYITTKRKIYKFNPDTDNFKKVFEMPSFWKNDFYGVKTDDNYLYTNLARSASAAGKKQKILKFEKGKIIQLPFIKSSTVSLKKGKTFTLKVYRGTGSVKYTCSNKKLAKVNSKGKVKALKKGTCIITAVKNGITMKCKVNII